MDNFDYVDYPGIPVDGPVSPLGPRLAAPAVFTITPSAPTVFPVTPSVPSVLSISPSLGLSRPQKEFFSPNDFDYVEYPGVRLDGSVPVGPPSGLTVPSISPFPVLGPLPAPPSVQQPAVLPFFPAAPSAPPSIPQPPAFPSLPLSGLPAAPTSASSPVPPSFPPPQALAPGVPPAVAAPTEAPAASAGASSGEAADLTARVSGLLSTLPKEGTAMPLLYFSTEAGSFVPVSSQPRPPASEAASPAAAQGAPEEARPEVRVKAAPELVDAPPLPGAGGRRRFFDEGPPSIRDTPRDTSAVVAQLVACNNEIEHLMEQQQKLDEENRKLRQSVSRLEQTIDTNLASNELADLEEPSAPAPRVPAAPAPRAPPSPAPRVPTVARSL
eukprot:RCo038441